MKKLLAKIRAWWRGGEVDPAAQAEGKRIRDDVETIRTGALDGPPMATHSGKDARRGF